MSAVNSNPKTPLYSDFMAFHLPVYAYSDGMNVNDDGETTITTSPLAANSSDTVQLIVGKAQQIFPVSIEVLSTTAGSAPKMVLISGASGDKLQTVKDWLVKNCDRQVLQCDP